MKLKELELGYIMAQNTGRVLTARNVFTQLVDKFKKQGFRHPRGIATYLMKHCRDAKEDKFPNRYEI